MANLKGRESQRSSMSHTHASPVQLRPLHPFHGPLAQSARALACRAKGSGSITRTDRQFPRARSDRRQHGCFAHSRRRSVTVRVHHFRLPREVKQPVGLLSRSSWCESTPGSQFQRSTSGIDEETVSKTAAPRIGVQSAILWCSAFSSLRSSTAEHPPDKRETVARHHAEGPFYAGWLRQMSGGLKPRSGWRATNSSDHFIAALM